MSRPHIEPYVETMVPFRRMTLPGFGKGMHYKVLSLDSDTAPAPWWSSLSPGIHCRPE